MENCYRAKYSMALLFALFTGHAASAVEQGHPVLQGGGVVDLSHVYDDKTIYWPTSPTAFELKTLAHGHTDGGYFYSANSFCTPEHGGTHMDAPIHFADATQTIDEVPVERLVAPAVVIDVSAAASKDPDYRLQPADIERWEGEHGRIPEHAIVVLRTGWEGRWGDVKAYLGDDRPGDASNLHFPSYGAAAAAFLVKDRNIAGLGVDTASIDHGASKDFMVHRVTAEANVFGLENLTNLGQLPATGTTIIALPMKIAGGSGGPVRVIAVLP
jgi:kynurenine formamidase